MTFQTEPWAAVEADIIALAPEHWEMLALNKETIPLDVDWDLYRRNADDGILHVLSARADNGELVGYYMSFVRTHPNYRSTLFGMIMSYFIRTTARTPTVGLEFLLALENEMKRLGRQVPDIHDQVALRPERAV